MAMTVRAPTHIISLWTIARVKTDPVQSAPPKLRRLSFLSSAGNKTPGGAGTHTVQLVHVSGRPALMVSILNFPKTEMRYLQIRQFPGRPRPATVSIVCSRHQCCPQRRRLYSKIRPPGTTKKSKTLNLVIGSARSALRKCVRSASSATTCARAGVGGG